jgi:ribonuclease HI
MRVTIIADASYDQRYGIGAYGYWIASARGKIPGEGVLRGPVVSSMQAEMMAIVRALYDAVRLRLVEPGDEVLIQTDCTGAIDALSGRRSPVSSDKVVLETLDRLTDRHQLTLTFKHVKGHTKLHEARYAANRACDARAKRAMREERDKRKMPVPRAEWMRG